MSLVYLSSAWLLGIYLHFLFHPSPFYSYSCPFKLAISLVILALLGFLSLVILFLWREDWRVRLFAACVIVSLLGAWRYSLSLHNPGENDVDFYNDRDGVVIQGLVVGEPDVRDRWTNLHIEVERLTLDEGERIVKGVVLVRVLRYPEYRYGDWLQIEGKLETPPILEDFSYRDYLARQGIHSMMYRPKITLLAHNQGSRLWAALYSFKAKAQATITQILPEPEASLLTGILLGADSGIPEKLVEFFNATSTSHVIAISGFNLSLLSGIFAQLGRRLLGKRFSVLFAIGSIVLYTLFVGANAAVVRAAIMSILYVIAIHFGRPSEALTALMCSAMLMTLINPNTLFDVSFQLSFAATLGLILYTRLIENWLTCLLSRFMADERVKEVLTALNDVFTVTLAAQLFVLPIIVYYFRRLSLIGQLTNFLVLPVQSGVMIWGGIATLLGLVYPPLGQIVGWVVWLFLTWTIRVVKITARVPYASIPVGPPSPLFILLYYSLLLSLWLNVQETYPFPKIPWRSLTNYLPVKATLLALTVIATLVWVGVFSLPDGYLHVVFFDVGQGDSIFIESPTGQQILVDGGPSPATLLSALGREMPFWDRSLDLVVMTHPDADHIGGLVSVLDRYRVEKVLEPDLPCDSDLCNRWQALLEEKAIAVQIARRGMRVTLEEGLWMEVLHPPSELLTGTDADDNNNSIVLRLVYGKASFLLTGDLEQEGEWDLLASDQQLSGIVLKVSHHGAKAGTTGVFLQAVQPQLAIISVGENRFGHPAAETLERLGGIKTLRTDEQGSVKVTTDRERYWIETEH